MAELDHPTDVTGEPAATAASADAQADAQVDEQADAQVDAQVDELADLDDIDMDFDLDEVENRIAPLALAERTLPGSRR